MNPLIPPLAVSAAYVALSDREHGARILAALRSPLPSLALTRLWHDLCRDADPDEARFAEVVYVLAHNLTPAPNDYAAVVGKVVRVLTPPPVREQHESWTRPGAGSAWLLRSRERIPDEWQTCDRLSLGAVYAVGDEFDVVGCDLLIGSYDEAATVAVVVGITGANGLDKGLRSAMANRKQERPGADLALTFIERLAGAVEGL